MILLDTHVLIWYIQNPKKIPSKTLVLIEKARKTNEVYISSITVWEIAMLVEKQRLKLKISFGEWLQHIETLPFVNFIPVNNNIAKNSVLLGENIHADPADRIIVATAIELGVTLVTADDKLLKHKSVKTVW